MKTALSWILSVAAAAVFLTPLLWMLAASLRTEATIFQPGLGAWLDLHGWTLSNYAEAWRRAGLAQAILVSALQTSGIVIGGLFINAAAAYAFARLEFPGREPLFALIVVLIILPIEILAVPLFFCVRDLGLLGSFGRTLGGLTLPFLANAFNIYFLRQHFLALPTELEEAAVVDGAGPWRQFWSVALPAIRPALATAALLDLLAHWGDFLWPLLLGTRASTRTVQIGLADLFTQPPVHYGAILACAVIVTLPVIVLFRWLQRHVIAADLQSGIK